jgi:peptidoglycan/xylan/chitin deacetylase (PgdA/CDA1 family)
MYKSFSRVGGDRLLWRLDGQRLRVLCYHGVCDDHLAGAPWLPSVFVTRSSFVEQLEYLRREANVLPLEEAVDRLRDGSLPPRSVSLTFDDGYANNLRLAVPSLRLYGLRANIFVSSRYVETGEMFPFLKIKLIRLWLRERRATAPLLDYGANPLDQVMQCAAPLWEEFKSRLTTSQRETLRPMSIAELREADTETVTFSAHSDAHCVLRNESDDRRRSEIALSVEKVSAWTGRPVRAFAYPNGELGDFGEIDKQALRDAGVRVAVSGISGANGPDADVLALRRYPITIGHDAERFSAEVTGFSSAARSLLRSWRS